MNTTKIGPPQILMIPQFKYFNRLGVSNIQNEIVSQRKIQT